MASKNSLLLLLLLPLLLLSTAAAAASSRTAELDALMELKAALDPSGRALASWARGGDPCGRGDYFEGVSCDARGRVATISLQGRGLRGTVPPAVAMLPGLTGLYLHYNKLGGEIPRELGGLPELAELYLGVNNLSGSIPVELGRLGSLQVLQLGYNQLSGSIPTQLGQLKKLTVLALQSNQLTGAIPASLGDLPALTRLDLSSNHLFGSIPSKLAEIPQLATLDLRNNTLSGTVPSGLKKLYGGFRYENNSELCGAQFDSLRACPNDGNDDGKMPHKPESTSIKPQNTPQSTNLNRNCDNGGCSKPSTLSSGAVLVGTVIIVAGVAACCLSVFSWRRRQKQKVGSSIEHLEGRFSLDQSKETHQRSASSLINVEYSSGWDTSSEGSQHGARLSSEGSPSVRFNLEEVECATQYFSDVNLLGKSSFAATYKGIMRDGSVVAIKSINKSSCKSEEADFLRGLRMLTSLWHDNLVGLRGFCRSRARGECFLVYEFMGNGSLSRYLDVKASDAGAMILDWATRVSIIKGIAKGIDYLHSSKPNKPSLVHQSISADKVLVDHLFVPHLSGAGLHKLLADDVVFSTLKDSAAMGYLAPEYTTTGRFTDKSDVYAFGVVVFQVLTGRRTVAQLRLGAESGRLDDLVDPRLGGRFSRPEAAKLTGIALLCTSEAPGQRPAMAAVLQQLGTSQ
ncbi:probable leucine-rich repeat receptor-like serine/threonine-protein kinase At3g14840 [Phragmites australis]|uniref:probable leucine-rich repeat receptor-like serine/threonine-protein kinase At3g14840 n=1 Tax=Phragmites australis TaxID=29695 RepID=UPI002D79E5AC|nr:probable leucine-rich repeat receptor-like serine/threonine-protein kinase At3g14840 [Phragmites australis]